MAQNSFLNLNYAFQFGFAKPFESSIPFGDPTIESPLSHQFGITYYWESKNNIAVEAGIQYALETTRVNYNFRVPQTNDPSIPNYTKVVGNYLYVPVNVYYNLISKENFGFGLFAGMQLGTLLWDSEETEYMDSKIENTKLYTPLEADFRFNGLLGLNADWIFENYRIRTMPYVSTNFVSHKNGIYASNPWFIGVQLNFMKLI